MDGGQLSTSVDDLENVLITTASTTVGRKPIKRPVVPVASKQPRQHLTTPSPVKGNPSPGKGKRILLDKQRYISEDNSSAFESGEEVDSPVRKRPLNESETKRKKIRRSRSPSLSAASDSGEESTRVTVAEKRKRPPSVKESENKRSKRSRSPRSPSPASSSDDSDSSAVSRTSQTSQISHRSQPIERSSVPETSTSSKSKIGETSKSKIGETRKRKSDSGRQSDRRDDKRMRIDNAGPSESVLMPPPPNPTERNQMLMRNVLDDKISRASKKKDVDQESVITGAGSVKSAGAGSIKSARSKKAKPSPKKTQHNTTVKISDLLERLSKDIPDNDLTRRSLELILRNCTSGGLCKSISELNSLYEEVEYISVVQVDIDETQPFQIDTSRYLMVQERSFGYDRDALEKGGKLVSLLHALSPECQKEPDSLDCQFRMALKALASRMNVFDETKDVSMNNPSLISGRFVELFTFQYLRDYYLKKYDEDLVTYFTIACKKTKPWAIATFVENSVCIEYLRRIVDFYGLRDSSFDSVLAEPFTPQNMRIWTDPKSQRQTNRITMATWDSAYNRVLIERNGYTEEQKMDKPLVIHVIEEFKNVMKTISEQYRTFLAQALKVSELMCWMCFGILIDDPQGILTMAFSYCMVRDEKDFEQTKKVTCWNYLLASMYRQQAHKVVVNPIIEEDSFVKAWMALMNDP